MWLYSIIKFFSKIWCNLVFRIEVIGKENLPKEGSAVLCCNHSSNYDPLVMAIYMDRLPRYIAKKELFRNKFCGWVLTQVKAFPIDRESTMDMKAFKMAVNTLKGGEMLGIFAEGTRVKEGEAKAAKAGVALFAMKGEAPIIPVAITGSFKFRTKVRVCYGEAMPFTEYRDKKLTTDLMEEITEQVMTKIKEMKEMS